MSESISWSELAELTHATQVEKFNFCMCEDNEGQENPYADCPNEIERAIANLKKANSTLLQLFGLQEGDECDVCEAKDGEPHCDCGNCDCGESK